MTSFQRIIAIMGTKWLLHPSNKVGRLTPMPVIPERAVKPPARVERLTPFNKDAEQLRKALGAHVDVIC
ncbi:hypothetical protein [Delftia phage PhiW-14]|uniref:Uncharacterized protein n=1 Tax=Delftia phage PhiW-14 TaxID=665032 RepID=C9DFY8_BPW14|nr:hypothetical protein DP-phiW-14_gp016 [Delftia phage PhiW-14]ACV50039.1 hypothetical protein [Delftia phage PhiW-14]